jgi:hypothetical protein
VDPCNSSASLGAGPYCYLVDVVGGGDRLDAIGASITVTARDNTNAGIPDIPAADFWLVGCNDGIVLCGGSSSINADSVSNASGTTTITGALRGGGCDTGVNVVIQGTILEDPLNCGTPLCLPITAVSPDYDKDLTVDVPDFTIFAAGYTSPPKPYDSCLDFNCDGNVELVDFTIFAQHYLIVC